MPFFTLRNISKRTSIAYLKNQNFAIKLFNDSKTSLPYKSTKPNYSHNMAPLLIIALILAFLI